MSRLQGKVALVTGAAAGIGRAFAERLAEDGADLVLADVNDASAVADGIGASGGRALAVECDVSQPESVASLAERALGQFGKVDILVNNAGIYPPALFAEIDFATWRQILSVNLDGPFLTAKAFVPGMQERGWGRIVNVVSGTFWLPIPTMSHYIASKAGLIGLTRALATELGESGITVNAVAPGLVATEHVLASPQRAFFDVVVPQQAIRRRQVPDDLVGTLSFLVSDEAAFITGQTISVDGGVVRL